MSGECQDPTPPTFDCWKDVLIFGQAYPPDTTQFMRVPQRPPKPGAPRDRPSASQEPRLQQDHRHDPARARPAHGADATASSPRVPDARRAARPSLGVAGDSTAPGAATIRSPARSRPPSATSKLAPSKTATPWSRRAARTSRRAARGAAAAISGSALRVRPRSRCLASATIPRRQKSCPTSSLRVPDARRGARPNPGVAGTPTDFRSARSRPSSFSSLR